MLEDYYIIAYAAKYNASHIRHRQSSLNIDAHQYKSCRPLSLNKRPHCAPSAIKCAPCFLRQSSSNIACIFYVIHIENDVHY
ncbi:hypothetical protein BCN_5048 [Bacillus cereus NC7401]|nr:hypothetical protein BCN_5048 [Bacillus cereus NC7401]